MYMHIHGVHTLRDLLCIHVYTHVPHVILYYLTSSLVCICNAATVKLSMSRFHAERG